MLRLMRFVLPAVVLLSVVCSIAPACPVGDLYEDCRINYLDLRELAARWLDPSCSAPLCSADLDGIAGVDMFDFAFLAYYWGARGEITLVVNEFMADNERTIEDPDDPGDFPDWIEIYNYGDDPVNIGGMYITDHPDRPYDWKLIPTGDPDKTTIPAGGFLLIWADGDPQQGTLHVDFGLGRGGDEIALYDPYKNLVDYVIFGAQGEDQSRGRLPDGAATWVNFALGSTTPGKSNRGEPVRVMISEIMYHPFHELNEPENAAQEYMELFNNGSQPVDLSLWRFSNGVDYLFPNGATIDGQGYLVVAADVNAFTAKYPGVANVIGGWTGRLSNSGERVELVDDAGVIVDTLRYSDQGEWAQRLLGPAEYGHRGWTWSDEHDGQGKSLELINPNLPNDHGQNWGPTDSNEGTPGRLNTVDDGDIAPLILDVEHTPLIPGPDDPVIVTAQIIDESATGFTVTLHYRVDRSWYQNGDEDIYPHYDPNDYNDVPMFDDGAHGDGDAGDGVYGAQVPEYPDGAIVEFFVGTSDAGGNSRTWPAPSLVDDVFEQVTNALYQVDASFDADTWTAGTQPIYYLIMTENEKRRLLDIGDGAGGEHNSDAQMNTTFISVDGVDFDIRHNVGVRNRGHGSRRSPPNNYRVNFANDRPWHDVTAANLNTKNTFVQIAGGAVFRASGIAAPEATPVQVRLNGQNMVLSDMQRTQGSYAHLEVVNSDFAKNRFPDDDNGNVYKGMRDAGPADFRYRGEDPDSYSPSYLKRTNKSAYDWSDVAELCFVLDRTPDSNYVREVKRVIDVENWIIYFALNALLENNETSLANGYGDDYYLYRGVFDRRFVLVPHDLDSIFGYYGSNATRGIFRATSLATIDRFLTHPQFIPRYYFHLNNLIETTLSAEQIGPFLDELLDGFVPQGRIDGMKDFVARRNAHVLSLIPTEFTIYSDLPIVDGYHHTTVNTFTLSGTADAINTRSILVNGQIAEWSPVGGTWGFGGGGTLEPIVDRGSIWKYLDDGSDGLTAADGVSWFAHPDYDDTLWSQGPAELGYGDAAQGRPEATDVNSGPDGNHYITTYFRHAFEFGDASQFVALQLGLMRDDGAVVYLNGVEIEEARSNMPAGNFDYLTRATANVGSPGEYTFYNFAVDARRLREGRNVLAVEIHQVRPSSPDISFDLELFGITPPKGAGTMNPGINRIIVRTFDGPDGTGAELESGYVDIWFDTAMTNDYPKESAAQATPLILGELPNSAIWTPGAGPYRITDELLVPAGITLIIMPGATIFFEPDARIMVNGTLIARGSEYESVRFTSTPGAAGPWGGIQFDHSKTDNRIAWAVLEYGRTNNGMIGVTYSNLTLDHLTFDNTDLRRIRTIYSSLIVRNCWFTDIFAPGQPPTTDNMSEHIWGRAPDTGWFIIENNVFGTDKGHNDAIDVDGPSRPSPIPQILNNLFMGGGDDALDLVSDAHIEGNVFANFARDQWNTASGESNVISAGGGRHYVMVRNIFYNNQHIAQVKDDAFLTFANNTVVGVSEPAIYFDLGLSGRGPGRGADVDGSIFWNAPQVFAGVEPTTELTIDSSILPFEWHYAGAGNIDADPTFVDERDDFRLKPGSGAVGAGSWGLDMGAFVPSGAAISGEPYAVTYRTSALLRVGGPGITHYKYSVNAPNGPFSAERSVDQPILRIGLLDGQSYTVYAIGKNSAGVWQSEDNPTASHTWTVDVSHSELLINEVLAHTHGVDPDIIELYYDGPGPIDLTGMSLTDDPANPEKFVFGSATVFTTIMNPGDYMVLYGDLTTQTNHLGFALRADGEALYLYDKPAGPVSAHELIDSVEFGPQINDFSIGRVGYDRTWKLNRPTFMAANLAQPLGDPDTLKINEWLADGQVLFDDDFIELYNPHPLPVKLSGMYLTDHPVTQPDKHRIAPLSFIPPQGHSVFRANDGNDAWELNFKLSAEGEMIALFDNDLNLIDQVLFAPQTTDVSQGRIPDGAFNYEFFALPTPGVTNAVADAEVTVTVLVPEDADKRAAVPASPNDIDDTWRSDLDFNDANWLLCSGAPGGIGFEIQTSYEPLITLDVQSQMYENNATCYVRIPFTVDGANLPDYTAMTLKTRYDDGFVAYLNGVEVTREIFVGTPEWNSATGSSHEAIGFDFDAYTGIFRFIDVLNPGENLLAIHGINRTTGSSDFLISAELEASVTTFSEDFPYENDLDILVGLRITELMYHAPSGSNFDYIEFQNISDIPLNLDGVRLIEGVKFVFPYMQLGPGQYVVVVSNIAAFRAVYGFGANIAGVFENELSNRGEDIVLQLAWPLEAAALRFDYSDTWYPSTDGGGESLAIIDPTAHPSTWDDAQSWRPAPPSPGAP